MLRDAVVGLSEPMQISAGVDPLALTIQKQASDDSPSCLANPRPDRAESSLTENATSPFQAEPAQEHPSTHFQQKRWTEPKIGYGGLLHFEHLHANPFGTQLC